MTNAIAVMAVCAKWRWWWRRRIITIHQRHRQVNSETKKENQEKSKLNKKNVVERTRSTHFARFTCAGCDKQKNSQKYFYTNARHSSLNTSSAILFTIRACFFLNKFNANFCIWRAQIHINLPLHHHYLNIQLARLNVGKWTWAHVCSHTNIYATWRFYRAKFFSFFLGAKSK